MGRITDEKGVKKLVLPKVLAAIDFQDAEFWGSLSL